MTIYMNKDEIVKFLTSANEIFSERCEEGICEYPVYVNFSNSSGKTLHFSMLSCGDSTILFNDDYTRPLKAMCKKQIRTICRLPRGNFFLYKPEGVDDQLVHVSVLRFAERDLIISFAGYEDDVVFSLLFECCFFYGLISQELLNVMMTGEAYYHEAEEFVVISR